MNEAESKSNLLGLIVLAVVYIPLGILLGFFYVILQTTAEDIWLNVLAPVGFGAILAAITWIMKRIMKITNDFMSVIVTAIGTLIILFVVWNIWFTVSNDIILYNTGIYLNYAVDSPRGIRDIGVVFSNTIAAISGDHYFLCLDCHAGYFVPCLNTNNFINTLRSFNYTGTWSLDGTDWYGARLWAVWGAETLILLLIPILAAYASAGLFITELNAWVEERLMNFGFTAFDDHELDRIGMGEIEPILEKPLETKNGPMSAIAVCYHKGEPTDFIAIYKAHWDKEGALAKGRHVMTVNLGAEKIDALDAGLQAKHYPAIAKQETPEPTLAPEENEWNEANAIPTAGITEVVESTEPEAPPTITSSQDIDNV